MSYQTPRNVRRDSRTLVGRFRGGKLVPVMATAVRGNEGGLLSQQITLELDPIAGRMITPITAEVVSVFVPLQAIDAIDNPEGDYAGLTEVVREKLLSGNPLYSVENENEITKRLGVNPRSVSGQKRVSRVPRLAHIAAVNHLRRRKYTYATLLDKTSTAVTPALIGQTVLDRFNGVLDPDDRINGAVQLDIPDMQLPVAGIGIQDGNNRAPVSLTYRQTGDLPDETGPVMRPDDSQNQLLVAADGTTGARKPAVFAELNGVAAGGVALSDFYNAEQMDRLTRKMRQIVDDNPEYGEEMVLRWAHGLAVDTGKTPFVIYENSQVFARNIVPAMDTGGVQDDVKRSDMMQVLGFNVPIPRTELGGVIVTFAAIKPDETISSQPCPFLSDAWSIDNFVADELALDPMPVTIRELDADCDQGDESTIAFYTGLNQLKANYISYGLNRHLDPETVENKTAVWQLEVPLSVTPDTILYPENLPHTPFADQTAEVCTYVVSSNAVLQTPMIVGPTPVEELAIIDDADIFEEGEE